MRHTATASTSCAFSAWRAASSEPVSSSPRTSPLQSTLSSTGNLRYRGTSGGGASYLLSRGSSLTPRRISSASRVPSVVSRPVRLPPPVRTALVATVVPWTTRSTLARKASTPAPRCSASSAMPRMMAPAGSAESAGTLCTAMSPAASQRAKSTKVPPTSTPMRYAGLEWDTTTCYCVVRRLHATRAMREGLKPARHGQGLAGTRGVDGQGLWETAAREGSSVFTETGMKAGNPRLACPRRRGSVPYQPGGSLSRGRISQARRAAPSLAAWVGRAACLSLVLRTRAT